MIQLKDFKYGYLIVRLFLIFNSNSYILSIGVICKYNNFTLWL